MASPQIENGFTSVANELMEVLSRARFTQYQFRIVCAILRNSYGVMRRKFARVSYSYLAVQCHMRRVHVIRTINELVALNVITKARTRRAPSSQVVPNQGLGTSPGTTLALNKDWERWAPGLLATPLLLFNGSVPEPLVPDEGLEVVPDQVPNKERKKEKEKKHTQFTMIAQRVIDYLNKLSGRRFTYTDANLDGIRGRLAESHTEEECLIVCANKWKDPSFDKKYYRPVTLFRPSNFEGYLNENIGGTEDAGTRFLKRHNPAH